LQKRVDEVMAAGVITCAPDDTLRHVMDLMTRHHVRHLPVLDHRRLAGIISIGDVVKHRLDELQLEADVMRDAYLSSH
jgi:CBS domain-containing protein